MKRTQNRKMLFLAPDTRRSLLNFFFHARVLVLLFILERSMKGVLFLWSARLLCCRLPRLGSLVKVALYCCCRVCFPLHFYSTEGQVHFFFFFFGYVHLFFCCVVCRAASLMLLFFLPSCPISKVTPFTSICWTTFPPFPSHWYTTSVFFFKTFCKSAFSLSLSLSLPNAAAPYPLLCMLLYRPPFLFYCCMPVSFPMWPADMRACSLPVKMCCVAGE